MLVSKIQTYRYLSDKMHLKKVITKKPAIFGVSPNLACFVCNNFSFDSLQLILLKI
jgi:hypothetical protein